VRQYSEGEMERAVVTVRGKENNNGSYVVRASLATGQGCSRDRKPLADGQAEARVT